MDYSALITLHRLELLSAAIEYFGGIQIPSSYMAAVLRDAERLRPHQLSQWSGLEHIQGKIRDGVIGVEGSGDSISDRTVIDEYSDHNPSARGLKDLKESLDQAGRLTKRQREEFDRVSHRDGVNALGGNRSTLACIMCRHRDFADNRHKRAH